MQCTPAPAAQLCLQVSTIDHEDDGRVRLDLRFAWDADDDPVPVTPDDEIVCDVSAGYICARDACSVLWHEGVRWHNVGESVLLAEQDGMLIEYDVHTFSAIGAQGPAATALLLCSHQPCQR